MRLGLQKLTLLDFPGVVACTVFSCGCNFRCPFCHNASLVLSAGDELLPDAEVLAFLRKRAGILDGVCFTGGEPLLHEAVPDLMRQAKDLGYKVKLDTNGSFPERLQRVLESEVADYVAMDIKNSPAKYARTSGSENALPLVERSVELLMAGSTPYEFRTTVTGNLHEVEDFAAIGRWIGGAPRYFLQAFLESGEVLVPDPGYAVSAEKLAACLAAVRPFVPAAEIRGREPGK